MHSDSPGAQVAQLVSSVYVFFSPSYFLFPLPSPVKICTLPKRDMDHYETGDQWFSGSRERKRKASESEVYYVIAIGKDNFEALQQVGRVLEKNRPGGDVSQWQKELKKANNRDGL